MSSPDAIVIAAGEAVGPQLALIVAGVLLGMVTVAAFVFGRRRSDQSPPPALLLLRARGPWRGADSAPARRRMLPTRHQRYPGGPAVR